MALVADGDSGALGELYHRYSGKLLRYFFRMLWKDEALAQDFLHDLFLKVMKHAGGYDDTKSFNTWLYSVAHNMCKNEYRRDAFRKSVNHPGPERADRAAPDTELEEKEFRLLLDRAIVLLDEDDRHLYALRFELEMPLAQIAEMLGCPEGTVKSRLFHLKKKLADRLAFDLPEITAYGSR